MSISLVTDIPHHLVGRQIKTAQQGNGQFNRTQIACQMAFVSIGNAPCSIIVAIVRKFVLLLPLIYIMPQLISDKTMGVYSAEPIADVIAVTFTAILFTIQFKKALKSLTIENTKETVQ